LIGKEMFDKKIGLLAAFFASVIWVDFFVASRIFPDSPSYFLLFLSTYLFYMGFVKEPKEGEKFGIFKEHKYYVWAFLPIYALSLVIRFENILFLIIGLLYLVMAGKFKKTFLDKNSYIGLAISTIVIVPYLIYTKLATGSIFGLISARFIDLIPIVVYKGTLNPVNPDIVQYFAYWRLMPDYFVWPLTILFLIGLALISITLVLGRDLIKKQNKEVNTSLFLIILLAVPLLFYGLIYIDYDPRYIAMVFPAGFILASKASFDIFNWLKKKNNLAAIAIIILIVCSIGYLNLTKADGMIRSKLDSQWQI